jgi:hypothetical protein
MVWDSAGSCTGTQMCYLLAISSLTLFNTRLLLGYGVNFILLILFYAMVCLSNLSYFDVWIDPYGKPVLPDTGVRPSNQWSWQGAWVPEASFWGLFLICSLKILFTSFISLLYQKIWRGEWKRTVYIAVVQKKVCYACDAIHFDRNLFNKLTRRCQCGGCFVWPERLRH